MDAAATGQHVSQNRAPEGKFNFSPRSVGGYRHLVTDLEPTDNFLVSSSDTPSEVLVKALGTFRFNQDPESSNSVGRVQRQDLPPTKTVGTVPIHIG